MSRVLIAGVSSHCGGRLAQQLERDPDVEVVVGVDTADPRHQFERAEFVRVDAQSPLIRRILAAAAIDTVLDVRPVSAVVAAERTGAIDVNGTAGILEACEVSDTPVRKLVFRSSAHYYGSEADDPGFFTEEMTPRHTPRTAVERSVVLAERALGAFAARNGGTTVTVLRCAEEIGSTRPPLLSLPVVPSMLGFDPRCQFIHSDDLVGVLTHATRHDLPGTYNAAADGVLALSEVASLLGKPMLPVVPPWGAAFAATQLARLGLRVPVDSIRELRFGRGLDNRRLKAAGYTYRYTSREAVLKLRSQQRLRPLLGSGEDSYRYQRDVEEFLRRSPSVLQAPTRRGQEPR